MKAKTPNVPGKSGVGKAALLGMVLAFANDTFRNDKKGIADLSKEILGNKKYQGKTVLVCWHHGTMPALAGSLGVTGYPKKVPDNVFDRVWQITYDGKGNTTFADRPQRLLPGDWRK
jgi:hypothetical protein